MNPAACWILCLALALPMCAQKPRKRSLPQLQAAFHRRDKNDDGYISRAEFAATAKDPAKVDQVFLRRDRDGDGRISEEEFTTRIVRAR